MTGKSVERQWMLRSAAGFAVMSGSILLMPLQSPGVIPGLLFWLGLALGAVGQMILSRRVSARMGRGRLNRWGLWRFFSNPAAKAADLILIAAAAATVVAMAAFHGKGFFCFLLIALTLFAFCLHCILNGRNYMYVTRRTETKQNKYSKTDKQEGGKGTR